MMDYYGFWLGFVLLFAALPIVIGAGCGLLWAWRAGRRGARLVVAGLLGGAGAGLLVFGGAVLLFRA